MMDWKTFVSEIVSSIVWPMTIIAIVGLLKKPLLKLLPQLIKVKYKDFELEFSQAVKELRKESEKVIPETTEKKPAIKEESSRLVSLADISPRAAVLEAWREVESAASACINKYDEKQEKEEGTIRLRTVGSVWPSLLKEGIVNEAQFDVMKELKKLRNLAAHAEDFSFGPEDAKNYILSALPLAIHLKRSS